MRYIGRGEHSIKELENIIADLNETTVSKSASVLCYSPFKPPFKYDYMGQCIFDNGGQLILDVRGCGFLTGTGGGLGYDAEKAANIQDKIGERITQIMNEDAGA